MTTLRPSDMGIEQSTVSINQVVIKSISWSKFKGRVPEDAYYYAHIYWNVDYRYFLDTTKNLRPKVVPRPLITPRSWIKGQQFVNDDLLRHQYGHYLIGCICALKYKQKIDNLRDDIKFQSQEEAAIYLKTIFKETLNQYLKIQKRYDEQTAHYYNKQGQQRWQKWIANQINSFVPKNKKCQNIKEVQQQKQTQQNPKDGTNNDRTVVTDKNTPLSYEYKSVESLQLKNQQKTTVTSDQRQSSKQSKKSRQSSTGKYRSNLSSQSNRRSHVVSSSRNVRIRKTSTVKYPPLPIPRKIISIN